MNVDVHHSWYEANQKNLMAGLAKVRETLERHITPDHSENDNTIKQNLFESDTAQNSSKPLHNEMPHPFALDSLCTAFALSSFERDILLLCAGMELDSRFPILCSSAHGDSKSAYPTFSLALAMLDKPHWNAITPVAALRRWGLIEVVHSNVLTMSSLRISERVLHYLTGLSYLDEQLRDFVEPLNIDEVLPPSYRELSQQIANIWLSSRDTSHWPIIQLYGAEDNTKFGIAVMAATELGMQIFRMRESDIPELIVERRLLARRWEREAILSNGVLLLDYNQIERANSLEKVHSIVEAIQGPVILTGRNPLNTRDHTIIRLEVNKLDTSEQRTLWETNLGPLAHKLNGQFEELVTQFNLDGSAIRDVCAEVKSNSQANENPEIIKKVLWWACRSRSRPSLDDLAQRIEPIAAWEDLVLPEQQHQTLLDIVMHVRQRNKVYDTWGFATKSARGLGISVLFSGVSGTGKTMAAEVLARELDLDLYRVDLSSVVSKYIGETEKNLRRIFDSAETGGAILLFDEADALFGKRSEVKDSHDRYANIEVSYLLQRMEAYRGLAILTTNLKNALDTAFMRRIRFTIHFPFPDTNDRAEIWQHIYPKDTPTQALNVNKLAQLNITGGNINNIAMNAAFLAADSDVAVSMAHLLRAAQSEYAKLEKPLTDNEVAGWL